MAVTVAVAVAVTMPLIIPTPRRGDVKRGRNRRMNRVTFAATFCHGYWRTAENLERQIRRIMNGMPLALELGLRNGGTFRAISLVREK